MQIIVKGTQRSVLLNKNKFLFSIKDKVKVEVYKGSLMAVPAGLTFDLLRILELFVCIICHSNSCFLICYDIFFT